MARMQLDRKFRPLTWLRPALLRLVNPRHLARAARLSRRPLQRRFREDSRLVLMAKIVPGGFLNYGIHDSPFPAPEALSLEAIWKAQRRYAELLIARLPPPPARVLDVGCGMGGLSRLLVERGYEPVGVTPDAAQVAHLRAELPAVPVIEAKFEDLDTDAHRGGFAAVIMSESLQYLDLSRCLAVVEQVLAPGGRWIVFDYFRHSSRIAGSGHPWPDFERALPEGGFEIESQGDYTDHVLPTLSFLHMWGRRFALPAVESLAFDFERKRPGAHYLFEESVARLLEYASSQVERIAPEEFKRTRTYRLAVIRRAS